jgi:hypothetical protein
MNSCQPVVREPEINNSISNILVHFIYNSTEQSPAWETDSSSASHEIYLIEPESSLPHTQKPTTCLYPELDRPISLLKYLF